MAHTKEREVDVTVRLPESLHDAVKTKAAADYRSMASWIKMVLTRAVNELPT